MIFILLCFSVDTLLHFTSIVFDEIIINRHGISMSLFPVLSSFMPYHRVCNKRKQTGVTSGAETSYPSGAHEFTSVFSGVGITRSFVVCVCFVDHCLSFIFFSLYRLFSFD